jgi:hypothetical protein
MMTDFGVSDFCIEQLTPENIIAKIMQLQQEHEAIVKRLAESSRRLSQQNTAMWLQLDKLLPKINES